MDEEIEVYLWQEGIDNCPYCGAELDEWHLVPEDENIRECYCGSHWWIEHKETKG